MYCGLVLEFARSLCRPVFSCPINDTPGTAFRVEETLALSKAGEVDPWRNSFRSWDRQSSQNTAVASQGLLQRKHWLILNSSHLPGSQPVATHTFKGAGDYDRGRG